MASTCSVCLQGKKTSVWCQDCDGLLCSSCTDQHQTTEETKNHYIMPFENYQHLPPFILNLRPYCNKHNKRFSVFCRNHDEPICMTCLKQSHRKCEDVSKIEDIIHNVKDSVLVEDTMTEAEAMCATLKNIADNCKRNLTKLNITHQEMKAGLEKKVDNLIKHLKNLKDKTISEMDSVYNETTNDLKTTLQIVQCKEKELNTILTQKDEIKKLASNYQTFIGIKEIEATVNKIDIDLNQISNHEKLMDFNLEFHVNKIIDDITSGIQTLGDTQVIKRSSTVSAYTSKPTEAQKKVQTPGPVQLQLQQRFAMERHHWCYGCCTLPSGLIVIADKGDIDDNYNDCKICIFKFNGTPRSIVKFKDSEGVYDVTPVDNHHVAVSHPDSEAISIINLDKGIINKHAKVVKKLDIGEKVTGMCCRGRDIVCCVEDKGLVRVNIDSGKVEIVVEDENVDYHSHVHISSNLVCYTCPVTDTLTVLDTQYKFIFEYKDHAILKRPTGVTLDAHGNIFVTGWDSDNLVVITSNGSSCHQLLGEDELEDPTAVHYDSSTNKLMVVNWNGSPVLIYTLGKNNRK